MKYLIVLFMFSLGFVFAQDPYTVKYSIAEGLPTSNIYSVFEDSQGYIWFGTDVGVLRFDGYSFEHFSTDDGLGDNEVFNVYEDKYNRIWFLTLNGELSFYHNGVFENTKNNALLKEASHPKIIVDAYELGDDLYILYRNGNISRINLNKNEVIKSNSNSAIFGFWMLDSKVYYVSMESIVDLDLNLNYSFKDKMNSSVSYRSVKHKDRLLFSIRDNILQFNNNEVTEVDKVNGEIIHLNSIDNKLWIGTRSGLVIKSKSSTKHYFKNQVVSYALKDSQGNYWVTTLNNGIKFIPNFQITHHEILKEQEKVNALQKDSSNALWIGTENGLFTSIISKNIIELDRNLIGKSDYIKKIRWYNNNLFSIGNTSISIINSNETKTLNFGANDFYYDGNTYLFSSSVVFSFLDSDINKFPRLRHENGFKSKALANNTLFRKRTNVISSYKNGTLLFGSSTGLYHYQNDSIISINESIEELNTSIQDIYYDINSNNLVVATNSKGVSILKNNELEYHITKKQKLSSNTCYAIEPFGQDYLIATNKGIDRITHDNNRVEVENLNRILGLKNEKVNDIEIIDSTIYLATDKGLLSFHSNALEQTKTKPKLVINDVLINDTTNDDLMNLSSNQNNLSLSFTGISFADYSDLDYQYRIDEEKWIPIENRNLDIKNLSHGTHSIELRVKGQNAVWSNVKRIDLHVNKSFWKTIPFILFVSLILALVVYYLVGRRIEIIQKAFSKERRQLQDQQDKIVLEKQMTDLEQKALRMQMNPHFIFNALNTIKGYYSSGDIKHANKYISQFSTLLREILENDQRLISLEKEIEIISLYFELIQLRYVDVFNCEIKVDPSINIKETGIPTLILQPLVENAIIHGLAPMDKKGELLIEFQKQNGQLICKVIDNGIGYEVSQSNNNTKNRKSKALQITRERIELENNSTDSNNFIIRNRQNNEGTEVIFKLPILNFW